MPRKQLVPQPLRILRAEQQKTRKDNKNKSWATLNTNSKFDIIGQDLISRGIIQA